MKDWEKLVLPNVDCRYGAPMGRSNILPDDKKAPIKLHLRKMRLVGGDYDVGGCYFGAPADLWAAWGYTRENSEAFMVRVIVRAPNRNEAKWEIRETLEKAEFYR